MHQFAILLDDQDKKVNYLAFDSSGYIASHSQGSILNAARKQKTWAVIAEDHQVYHYSLYAPVWNQGYYEKTPYRMIQSPTLILHGTGDIDIPVGEAFSLEQAIRYRHIPVRREIILGGDFWLREIPLNGGDQITDRITGEWRERKYREKMFREIVRFTSEIFTRL